MPKNTKLHQENRVAFCKEYLNESFGGDGNSTLWVDVDEKNFCSLTRRIIYVPTEFEGLFKFQHAESKTKIEHVMFFGAIARPRPKFNFDGRILLIPVCEKKIRKRNGKYGKKGEVFFSKVKQ